MLETGDTAAGLLVLVGEDIKQSAVVCDSVLGLEQWPYMHLPAARCAETRREPLQRRGNPSLLIMA
jgi:hypothetical protein